MVRKPSPQRQHSVAFKWEAVQVLHRRLAAGVTAQRVAEELEIDPSLLGKWARAVAAAPAGALPADVFPGKGRPRPGPAAGPEPPRPSDAVEAELRRLRRENERLRQEREFLKKAAAFFAKESR
jgi:transposase